jgi:hypothetical protein
MPNYAFQNTETEEVQEMFYHMTDAPAVGSIVELDGQSWKRLFTIPHSAPNGIKAIDPYSQKAFREKTGAMKGTVGDMWALSAEMSARRAEKDGGDKVKQKFFNDYSARKHGVKHTEELKAGHKAAKEHLEKGLKKLGIDGKGLAPKISLA